MRHTLARFRHRGRVATLTILASLVALAVVARATAQAGPDVAALDAYIAKARADWDVPGMAVAVVKDGQVVLAKGYGVRELGGTGPVDDQTLFAIASNSKAFTSAALAILVREGKLGWDDRVVDHLPWFQLYDPYVTSDVRIRDLLSHRTGFTAYSGDLVWYGTTYSREEVVRRARYLKPVAPFRASYGYSNVMFAAAGLVVEQASGQRWEDFVRARIFDPLGMTRTLASVDALAKTTNVATPHGLSEGALRAFPWVNWEGSGPAASVLSSVADMATWIRLQLGRGSVDDVTLFSDAESDQMWTPHASFTVSRAASQRTPSTHFRGYGLGWSLSDYRGRKIVEHGGAYDGMYSRVALVPEENLGLVVLTNSMTSISSALSMRILDAYLGGEPRDWSQEYLERYRKSEADKVERIAAIERTRIEGTHPSFPLAAYAGTYGGDLYGDVTVSLEDGRLVLRMLPNPDLVADLSHFHHDTFEIRWRRPFPWFGKGWAQFIMNTSGEIVEMTLDVPNDDFWFWEPEFKRR